MPPIQLTTERVGLPFIASTDIRKEIRKCFEGKFADPITSTNLNKSILQNRFITLQGNRVSIQPKPVALFCYRLAPRQCFPFF